MLFYGGNFARSRNFLHAAGMMPRMLNRSRLSRRLSRLGELVEVVFHQLGWTLKELNLESRDSLDSFPVAVCDNIRIPRCRLAQGERFRGYLASKRCYFYGVRVQVVVTVEGVPVEFSILPGSLSDIASLAELPLLPVGAAVAADAAYTYYESEDALAQTAGQRLLVGRNGTRSGATCPPCMITSSGCAAGLRRSLEKSPSCFRRRYMRRRFPASF